MPGDVVNVWVDDKDYGSRCGGSAGPDPTGISPLQPTGTNRRP